MELEAIAIGKAGAKGGTSRSLREIVRKSFRNGETLRELIFSSHQRIISHNENCCSEARGHAVPRAEREVACFVLY